MPIVNQMIMKKLLFLLLFTPFLFTNAKAENTMADLFAGKVKVTFLGLDLTQTKYIGKIGFTDPAAIKNQHSVSWNSLLSAEPKKFSLQDPLRIKNSDMYATNVDDMVANNKDIDVEKSITEDPYTITEDQVKKSVSKYKLSVKDGIGVAYVVESMSKTAEKIAIWVTFIDLSTKKVLYTERIEGKAGGFGFRNYWAGAVYQVNKAIDSKYYKIWSKKFVA